MNNYGDCKGCKHLVIYENGFGCNAQHNLYDNDVCPKHEKDGNSDETLMV